MKPTFRPVVYAHHKRADGTYNVKINVYFNGKERRLPTNIYCTQADLTRSHHIKSNIILSKCNTLITQMQGAIADISPFESEGKDVDWLVARIKAKLVAASFHLDFFEFADTFIAGMKQSTKYTYISAINSFAAFLKSRRYDINLITRKVVLDYIDWCESKPKMFYDKTRKEVRETNIKKEKGKASARYVIRLSTIFNAAKKKYNDEDEGMILIPRSPFNIDIEIPDSDGEKPLPVEVMQKVIIDKPLKPKHRLALDIVAVSFALQGVNFADMYYARPFEGKEWVYQREKTKDRRSDNAEQRVIIQPCLEPFLKRLGAGTSKEWWLPALHEKEENRQADKITKDLAISRTNRRVKAWCQMNGIEEFTTYAIRKTWATLARRFEDKAIADEAIGHTGGSRLLDIYAEKPYERYHELNRKVLALFEWE